MFTNGWKLPDTFESWHRSVQNPYDKLTATEREADLLCWRGPVLLRRCSNHSKQGPRNGHLCRHDMAESVTKKLDLLVVSDPLSQSGKAQKARQNGTRIMSELVFCKMLGLEVE